MDTNIPTLIPEVLRDYRKSCCMTDCAARRKTTGNLARDTTVSLPGWSFERHCTYCLSFSFINKSFKY